MSARKTKDICVVIGKYTDREGKEKNRYQTVGVEMETDQGGRFILLERSFNPAGCLYDASKGNTILLSMFDPKPHDRAQAQAPASAPAPADDSEIPF